MAPSPRNIRSHRTQPGAFPVANLLLARPEELDNYAAWEGLPVQRLPLPAAPPAAPPAPILPTPIIATEPLDAGLAFDQAVPSWNLTAPPGSGARIELRAGDSADGPWTRWYTIALWRWPGPVGPVMGSKAIPAVEQGSSPGGEAGPAAEQGPSPGSEVDPGDAEAAVEADTLVLRRPRRWVQMRITLMPSPEGAWPVLNRAALALSHSTRLQRAVAAAWRRPQVGPDLGSGFRLSVPFRSQRGEHPSLADHICGPTSLAMMLEHLGVPLPTAEVAAIARDAANDIYGNWPYLAAVAAQFGFPAAVLRLPGLAALLQLLRAGWVAMISIRFGPGELEGSPLHRTRGHLLVVTGLLDGGRRIWVNDPAGRTPEAGQVALDAGQLLRAWRNRVAVVLGPRFEPEASAHLVTGIT